jgi:hypothetical protein
LIGFSFILTDVGFSPSDRVQTGLGSFKKLFAQTIISNKKIPPLFPPSPQIQIEHKIKAKVVEVSCESGGIISTTKQIPPPNDLKFTLKLARVEVGEIRCSRPVYTYDNNLSHFVSFG